MTLVDVGGLLREVRRAPERFGLTNVIDAACNLKALPDQDVLFCDGKTLVAPDAAETYLYADDVHPTTAGQRIVAEHVLQALRRR